MRQQHGYIFTLFIVISITLSSGCSTNSISNRPMTLVTAEYDINDSQKIAADSLAFMSHVILGVGDVININFQFTPELNTTQQIRPDGKLSLQYIGAITAAGRSPEELRNELTLLYANQLRNPALTITIESLFSNRVFVGGDVLAPGVLETQGRITALESIIQSGGYNTDTSDISKVMVIRNSNGYCTGFQLDLRPAVKGMVHTPFYLESFDIVHVPQKKIISLNQWIDHYVDGIFPQVVSSTLVVYLLTTYVNE